MEYMHGRLEPFFETGTEGVVWSLINPVVPGYDGLYCFEDNDDLTIYNDDGSVAWEGIIRLEFTRNYTSYPMNPSHGQQAVMGFWVRGLQTDVDPDTWAQWFFDRKRARHRSNNPNSYSGNRPRHLFTFSAADILRASIKPCFGLTPDGYKQTFRSAHYAWINWYGESITGDDGKDSWHVTGLGGTHAKLLFSETEALEIIGSPSVDVIKSWRNWRDTEVDRQTFYRLALVSGIMGSLELRFMDADRDMRAWVDNQSIDNKPMRDCFFITRGLRKVHDCLRT